MKRFNSSISSYVAFVALLAGTAGPAVYFGRADSEQAELIAKGAERLTLVPTHFGPWQMRDEDSLSESALQLLGCSSHICRTYVHNNTGERVGLVLLVGPAGPLAVHTPEICLTNREYENIKPTERMELESGGRKFAIFSTLFRARTLEGQKLNVYYTWSRDGQAWEAPDSPRVTLGPLPMLYKIQVASSEPLVPTDGPSAGIEFLEDLLPLLE